MARRKPDWFWLAPMLEVVAHAEKVYYHRVIVENYIPHTRLDYEATHMIDPYVRATLLLAVVILLVFGWKQRAIVVWVLKGALAFLSFWMTVGYYALM